MTGFGWFSLTRSTSGASDEVEIISIRMQGFIKTVRVMPLGNWNGRVHDAVRAIQYVTLHSGGFESPFQAQVNALSAVDEFICASLGAEVPVHRPRSPNEIFLNRRVFKRAGIVYNLHTPYLLTLLHQVTANCELRSVLSPADAPDSKARKIANSWVVADKLMLGRQVPATEKIVRCLPSVFHDGDFVDVSFSVHVSLPRQHKHCNTRTVDIHHNLDHMVLLYSSAELKNIDLYPTRNSSSEEMLPKNQESGYSLDECHAVPAKEDIYVT
ncbi:uncharacterized protein LAESUDRAFT_808534 [Laetiporus sulphureus 93-53]|uniref:Uncharacterized protein n=1 Tax=Laetiporus sulphureus 93-53 TaxID=1314785 RepID=A0A165IGT9_9APHY|nr:uncharacterized protein LAESUDRAFT_808534 [Laetiporus sulphureus 93-53]KZT13051.1 hypothetical protein LAESUDRAFT_808534 [Laetiporus sulphureus 93-53]